MRILVIGGYGLIGSYVLSKLHADGHDVVGLGRNVASARRRFPYAEWIRGDLARMSSPHHWAIALKGADAVVNCAGALQDSLRDDLQAVHVTATAALTAACAEQRIKRFVHISAAGVGATRATKFNHTKWAAEEALKDLELDWIILRPGLVLAPVAYGGTALLRGLAAFPMFVPTVHADALLQVVSVEDVAAAVSQVVIANTPGRFSVDLLSTETTSLGEILLALRAWLGLRSAPLLPIPATLGAWLADGLSWLGWRSPMRSTSLAQLRAGVTGEAEEAPKMLGIRPKALADILAGWPSGVQERWFARLYFLKPTILAGLFAYWFAFGLIGLSVGLKSALTTLTVAGMPSVQAMMVVIGGSMVDIGLALAVCFRATAPWALRGMVLVCIAYAIGGSIFRPDLWLDPLGPLVKILPAALLGLTALAIMDER